MALPFILLAIQAAGMAQDLWATKQANSATRRGMRNDREETALRLEQERVASLDESVYNLEQLNANLAMNQAIYAARGQQAGSGSARAVTTASQGVYAKDERARELASKFRQYDIKTQGRLAQQAGHSSIGQAKQGLFQRSLNKASGADFEALGFGKQKGLPDLLNKPMGNDLSGKKKQVKPNNTSGWQYG